MSSASATSPRQHWGWLPPLRVHAEAWITAAIVGLLLLQFRQIFTRAINWDEFWHYNHIVRAQQGELEQVFQRLHAHLYQGVLALPGSNIDHIVTIRLAMFAFELVTLAAIIQIATRWTNRRTGLLCALFYLSNFFVIQHGASFRYDPPLTALLMSLLWLLACRPLDRWNILLGGLLVALIPFVSIKAVLYAPVFAGVLWWRWTEHGRSPAYLRQLCLMILIAALLFAGLYWLISQGVSSPDAQTESDFVTRSASKMLAIEAKPTWPYILDALWEQPLLALVIVAVPIQLRKSEKPFAEKIAIAGCWTMILTPLFYHNAAPYFYAFMLAPFVLACCDFLGWLEDRYSTLTISGLLFFIPLGLSAIEPPSPLAKQREMRAAADTIFDHPVAYFDFCGFLGNWPKVNPFMTVVGTHDYRISGKPVMRQAMEAQPVPLVIVNDLALEKVMETREPVDSWHPEDVAALRTQYVHYWGPFWIAGFDISPGTGERVIHNLVPGPYKVQGGAITVNGEVHTAGAITELKRGEISIAGMRERPVRLLWGNDLALPASPPPAEPYFAPF